MQSRRLPLGDTTNISLKELGDKLKEALEIRDRFITTLLTFFKTNDLANCLSDHQKEVYLIGILNERRFKALYWFISRVFKMKPRTDAIEELEYFLNKSFDEFKEKYIATV